jgi:hypothetical protein
MQTMYPERIVAVWLRSGTAFATWEKGEVPRPEIPAVAYDIPVMCNPGAKENGDERFKGAWDGSLAMFKAYRARDALIGFAPDPRTSHECGDSRYLAIAFFDACLAQRLPAAGTKLRPADRSQVWLAELLSECVEPVAAFKGDVKQAVWLPSRSVAQAWAEYVRFGNVADTTAPPAPFAVKVAATTDGNELTWDAHADLESGLQGFIVERDGQEIAAVPEKAVGRFGRPLFQVMSYHDTPERPVPAMRYLDRTARAGETHRYRVVAVNGVGLRSEPASSR